MKIPVLAAQICLWYFLLTIHCNIHAFTYNRFQNSAVVRHNWSLQLGTMSPSSAPAALILSSRQNLTRIPLILASQSPRRREILDMMGLEGYYKVVPSPLDETAAQSKYQHLPPKEYTRKLAEEKARALSEELTEPAIVLGSDTIVEQDDRVLEKPRSEQEARDMLLKLSGRNHAVHTGVALYAVDSSVSLIDSWTETATVWFASLTDQDIDAYIATGEPMDKAGSYGIQGMGGQFVERIDGDFFTVMGLPMHSVSRELAKVLTQIIP